MGTLPRNVAALANAEEGDVLHAWQGLATTHVRAPPARRKKCSALRWTLPERVSELLALPGITPYSAGAIASIAYGRAEPLVDGNVIRRVDALVRVARRPQQGSAQDRNLPLCSRARAQANTGRSQSILDGIGRNRLSPRSPRCSACPVAAPPPPPPKKKKKKKPELNGSRHRDARARRPRDRDVSRPRADHEVAP